MTVLADLNGHNLGTVARFTDDNGWEHLGVLTKIEHTTAILSDKRRAWISVKQGDGSTWHGHLAAHTPVELITHAEVVKP